MKKVTVALALIMSIGLTGCANTDIFSGDVYTFHLFVIEMNKLINLNLIRLLMLR